MASRRSTATLDLPRTVARHRGTAISEAEGLSIGAPGAGGPTEP